MKHNKKKQIQIKDLISIGIYTALYFVMVALSNVVLFIIPGYSYVFIPIIAALVSGTIYMLMVAKVQKFGAITIMGLMMGLNFFLTGRFPASIFIAIGIALIADLIAYASKYQSRKAILSSYVVFSFNTVGPVLPMFIFPEIYTYHLINQGRDATYIENAFADITQQTFIILVVGIIVAAVIGGLFGQRMIKKHFERAGIV